MGDTFIAFSCGTGFVGVNPGNDNEAVRYLFLYFAQAADIVADRIFIVSGTWADDYQKFIGCSGSFVLISVPEI